MKLTQVINADFRNEGLSEAAQAWLRKIDVLDKRTKEGSNVSLEDIEKLLHTLCKKYGYVMQWIHVSYMPERGEEPHYSLSFKRKDTHEWSGTVYGLTLYETFAKGLLLVYASVKKAA